MWKWLRRNRSLFLWLISNINLKRYLSSCNDIKPKGLVEMQHGIWEVTSFFPRVACLRGPSVFWTRANPLKTPGVSEGVSGPWICCVQGWVTGCGPEPARGRGQLLWGRPESWESLSHRNPVFVYGVQCSYLPPVLTPHSSCFKSLLLIFSSLLPQSQPVLLFLVFLFFSIEIR